MSRRTPSPTRPRCASRVAGRQLLTVLLEAAGLEDPARALRDGRVQVDSRRVRNPRAHADPAHEQIALDRVPPRPRFCHYIPFHEPYGVISHFTDRRGCPILADYVPIPRVYAAVGHPTLRLVRVAIGPLSLTGSDPGQWRECTATELE